MQNHTLSDYGRRKTSQKLNIKETHPDEHFDSVCECEKQNKNEVVTLNTRKS